MSPAFVLSISVLQWGRGIAATEKTYCAASPPTHTGFNEVVALQPRKGKSPAVSCRPVTRFNGAVALLPRKGHASGLPRKSFGALQWGLGFAAKEGSSSAKASRTWKML